MSNLLKVGTTITKDERIIDYNDVIKERVEAARAANLRAMDSDGFITGLAADVVEQIEDDGEEDWDMASLIAEHQPAQSQEQLESANQQAEDILEEAGKQAEAILAQAEEQANSIREAARNDGYNAGINELEQEYAEKKEQLEAQYNQRQMSLETEYNELKAQIEPALVEALIEVFSNVTHAVSEDNKDIVLHLINNVMQNADNCHEYTIKVSPEDYNFVLDNQGKIYCAMTNEVNLDIVQDAALKKNECMIETDTGVFNCSLDVELNNLIKDIRLLSCM